MKRRDPFNEGAEAASARRRRSVAIALALVAFVLLVFSVTAVRLGQNRDAMNQRPAAGGPVGGE